MCASGVSVLFREETARRWEGGGVSRISMWRMYLRRISSLKEKRVDGKSCDHQREIDDVVGRRKGRMMLASRLQCNAVNA